MDEACIAPPTPYYIYDDYYNKDYYGSLQPFYSIANTIIDGVQTNLGLDNMFIMYGYFNKSVTSYSGTYQQYPGNSELIGATNRQLGYDLLVSIGGVIVLLTWILLCCCRCSCSPFARKYTVGHNGFVGWISFTQLLIYVICFAFILTGTIIFGISVQNIDSAIQDTGTVDFMRGQANTTVSKGNKQLNCVFGKYIGKNFDSLTMSLPTEQERIIGIWKRNSGLSNLNTDSEELLISKISIAMQQGQDTILQLRNLENDPSLQTEVYQDEIMQTMYLAQRTLDSLVALSPAATATINATSVTLSSAKITEGQLTDGMSSQNTLLGNRTNQAEDKIQAIVNSLIATSSSSGRWTNRLYDTIEEKMGNIYNWNSYNTIKSVTLAVVAVSSSIALLIILLAFSATLYGYREQKGHSLSAKARWYIKSGLIGAFYVMAISSWITMAVAMAWVFYTQIYASTCYSLYDPNGNYDFYRSTRLEVVSVVNFNGKMISYDYGSFLSDCYNSPTLYFAMGVHENNKLLQSEQVLSFVNVTPTLAAVNSLIIKMDLNPDFDATIFSNFDLAFSGLKTSSIEMDNQRDNGGFLPLSSKVSQSAENAKNSMTTFSYISDDATQQGKTVDSMLSAVTMKTQISSSNLMTGESSDFYANYQLSIKGAVDNFLDEMNNNVYPARAVYINYQNSGNMICNYIRSPFDGLWAAAGLISIFWIPATLCLLYTATHVYNKQNQSPMVFTAQQPTDAVPPPYQSTVAAAVVSTTPPATPAMPEYPVLPADSLAIVEASS